LSVRFARPASAARSRALPARDVLLLPARDREREGGDVLGDGRPGRHEGVRGDPQRCDQIRVAANEGAWSDLRAVLGDAVVVHDDRPAAEARAFAHIGVSDVGEMVRLHAVAEHAVLHLDGCRSGSRRRSSSWAQVGIRADLHVVADPARLDHAAGLQVDARPDPRRALDHAARLDQRVGSDLDVHVYVGRRGIDDRDTACHHAVQRALAHARFGQRQLGARVHAERSWGW
jgi:hypothetical protein